MWSFASFDIAGITRRIALVLALLMGLQASGAASAADAPAYKLGTGDKVRVTVFNEKDLSGDFDVNDQGVIALPLIGQVPVRGKSLSEVETLIATRYGKEYLLDPKVNVEVLNYRPFFILGEVKNPGSYPYVNGIKVLNAIAMAGGYTTRARQDRVLVKHADNSQEGEQPAAEDTVVLPGDVIRVPERFF
jgi:protein involved in polysaccharide export with SLBB domain